MTAVKEKASGHLLNDNLKNLKPFTKKGEAPVFKTPVENAKPDLALKSSTEVPSESPKDLAAASDTAATVAKDLAKLPALPIIAPKEKKAIEKKIADVAKEKIHTIKKPAILFIEGFSAFGISNGDGIKDMAENFPGAKKFSWNEKDNILSEIKKHSPEQPLILVGHSFGGDTAVEVANELNSAKNAFRKVDLLISLDSVGFNNTILPINVQRNLNFFQEGVVPFLHGNPNIARNTDRTEVINELRSELHSKIEDSEDVQFKIFENIKETLGTNEPDQEIVLQIDLADLIRNQLSSLKIE